MLGSFPVVAAAMLATAAWAWRRRRSRRARWSPASLLPGCAVRIAKAAVDRPRPDVALSRRRARRYPSGHAAQAVAWIACAVVLARGGHRPRARAAGPAAVAFAVAVAATRVYLRVALPLGRARRPGA